MAARPRIRLADMIPDPKPEHGPPPVSGPGPIPGDPGPRRTGGGRIRDRRGRGPRGPELSPGPLAPRGVPAARTRAERFDVLALRVVRAVIGPWTQELGEVELAVEEVPVLPEGWAEDTVPLSAFVPAGANGTARIALFRRPLEHRAESGEELEALLLTVVVEQLAEVLGIPAEEIHPGYEAD